MSEQEIKAGSAVKLKSGGPLMTVNQVGRHQLGGQTLHAWCDWFIQDKAPWKKEQGVFPLYYHRFRVGKPAGA
jgi:uncharacterized protein YodC (DUF2158 family)